METEQPSGEHVHEETRPCPSCGALNYAQAVICVSCGVDMDMYLAAQPRLHALQADAVTLNQEQLEEEAAQAIAAEKAKSRQQLRRQVRILLMIGGVLAVMALGAGALVGFRLQLRRERLEALYTKAMLCLGAQEYLCARSGFAALLKEAPHYEDAQARLLSARLGLAERYMEEQQWAMAIQELDALLQEAPADAMALGLMEEAYNQWLNEAQAQENRALAAFIQAQIEARFLDDDE